MAETFLIVGLGNPGKQYQNTRHNAGFMAVDALAHSLNVDFEPWRGDLAFCAKAEAEGKTIYLLKPQTFMNLSGQAVSAFANFYKIPYTAVLVIFDDMSLPLGSIRVRRDGSAGGQNGMKNIIELAGTQNIARLRIGIGPRRQVQAKEGGDDIVGHVEDQARLLEDRRGQEEADDGDVDDDDHQAELHRRRL